ncbi:MAG: undecaprenyl-diphosphatase UppP [Candidatus Rokubacteria bacterium]|nr:undecaprenyl-diphosphatase UppP [Candidatus Rokubacteria bacterium]MBI3827369.1 undecaprenyl-diphosphatase UppP [Candidatus Rokubacteria bacterium]
MSYTQALVLGIVQGLTEFLPVSSSGHLILVPRLFGWPDQGLAFDAAMHLGTLLALLAYFRAELLALGTGALPRRVGALIVLATIPGALAGLLLDKWIEAHLRSALVVAVATAFWALVMWIADRGARSPAAAREPLERVSTAQALTVGVAQALALVPGTSRSGITITAGLFTGLDRATAARFAFLLGIPITAGAGGVKLLHLLRGGLGPGDGGPLALAVLCAFVAGWFAVWFLIAYLKSSSLRPFVVYRLLVAAAVFWFALR